MGGGAEFCQLGWSGACHIGIGCGQLRILHVIRGGTGGRTCNVLILVLQPGLLALAMYAEKLDGLCY